MSVSVVLAFEDWLFLGLYFSLLVGLSIYGSHRYHMALLYWRHKKSPPAPLRQSEASADKDRPLPKVLIQLPVFNERYVVERLIEQITKLRYPHERLEVQLLDDSTDDTQEIAVTASMISPGPPGRR